MTPIDSLAVSLQYHGSELIAIAGKVLVVSPEQALRLCTSARKQIAAIEAAVAEYERSILGSEVTQ